MCGDLVFGGHPTISPLALQRAGIHFSREVADDRRVLIYQSEFFEKVIPLAAKQIADSPFATLVRTAAQSDETSQEAEQKSLLFMRKHMILDTKPLAAVFIGGMEGIEEEYRLCAELSPETKRYLIGAPGGAARLLLRDYLAVSASDSATLSELLASSRLYPYLMSQIAEDLISSLSHQPLQ